MNIIKETYFECSCYSDEHRLAFKYAPPGTELGTDEPELYCSVFLHQYRNPLQRIWIAIKYIFNYKCQYGHFDSFIMKTEDLPKFKELISTYERDLECSQKKKD